MTTPDHQALNATIGSSVRKVSKALAAADTGQDTGLEPLLACSHHRIPILTICAEHAGGGLRCMSCWAEHRDRHTADVRACAACGDPCGDDPSDVPIDVQFGPIERPIMLVVPTPNGVRLVEWANGTVLAVIGRVHRRCVPPGHDPDPDDGYLGGLSFR